MAAERRSRAEKKAETRERLLAAGERLARRDGFARLTLDRVAEAAGLTKGAVYSNFESKEDFLLEVAVRATTGLTMGDAIFDGAPTLKALLESMADVIIGAVRDRPKQGIVALEFVTLALREPKLRKLLAAQQSEETEPVTDRGTEWVREHEHELPLPEHDFFQLLNAVAWGMLLRRLVVGPDALPDEVITWAFTRFAPPDSSA